MILWKLFVTVIKFVVWRETFIHVWWRLFCASTFNLVVLCYRLFLLKGNALINKPLIWLVDLSFDLHVRDVLNVFKVILLRDELILEKHNVVSVMRRLTLVTARCLALIASKYNLLAMVVLAVRLWLNLCNLIGLTLNDILTLLTNRILSQWITNCSVHLIKNLNLRN